MLKASKDPEERLRSLDGKKIRELTLLIPKIIRPKGREKECRYFQLKGLKDNELSTNTMIEGLYSVGRASINLSSYFDIDYCYI